MRLASLVSVIAFALLVVGIWLVGRALGWS